MKLLACESANNLGQEIDKETGKSAMYEFSPSAPHTFAKSVVPDHLPEGTENIKLEAVNLKAFMVVPLILITYLLPLNLSTDLMSIRSKFFYNLIPLFDQATSELTDKDRVLKAMASVNLLVSWMKQVQL
jgi:hypothetical protein